MRGRRFSPAIKSQIAEERRAVLPATSLVDQDQPDGVRRLSNHILHFWRRCSRIRLVLHRWADDVAVLIKERTTRVSGLHGYGDLPIPWVIHVAEGVADLALRHLGRKSLEMDVRIASRFISTTGLTGKLSRESGYALVCGVHRWNTSQTVQDHQFDLFPAIAVIKRCNARFHLRRVLLDARRSDCLYRLLHRGQFDWVTNFLLFRFCLLEMLGQRGCLVFLDTGYGRSVFCGLLA